MININSFLSIITLSVIYISAYAQRDIKTLEGKTSAQIIQITGTPVSKDLGETMPDLDMYVFSDTEFSIDRNTRKIDAFETKSSKYCILSDMIPDGIKVGDDISKLRGFDFAKSAYGRNKPSNALRNVDRNKFDYPILGNVANFVVYETEYHSIYFAVKDGLIVGWAYLTKADTPYEPYDGSIHLW